MVHSETLPSVGRVMGIDWGERRIGLAISDSSQTTAHPLATLGRRAGKRFPMKQLRTHLEITKPVGIVIGLPLTDEGTEDERSRVVRDLGAMISEKTHLPIAYRDERMTTARALATIREFGETARGHKKDLDQMAAAVMLQSFLDGRR